MTSLKDEISQIEIREKPNIKGDKMNIALLILMYMLQGAIFGLTHAFPIILQHRKVSYAEQVRTIFTYKHRDTHFSRK